MNLNGLRPMLTTAELPETIAFYTEILGFAIGAYQEDRGWASLSKDGIEIMFSLPNDHIPFEKAIFTGSFYFNTDQVDEWWERLKDKAKICYAIETFDYGMREFAIV